MRLRLQFSLLTLLVLTGIVGVVIAWIVVPWRHDQQQTEMIERLKAHNDYFLYNLYKHEENSYDVEYRSISPKYFQSFIDLTEGCERIRSIKLETESFNDEQLAKLKQLPKLERLEFYDCDLTEARTQILRTLPLKELEFRSLDKVSFQTWPIQPRLESLKLWMMPEFVAPALKLVAHPRLRELNIDSCPHNVVIESCPELQNLHLYPPFDELPTKIKLKNLPKLESLSLSLSDVHADSQLQEFPALQKLSIHTEAFHLFQNHKLQNLKEFTSSYFKSLKTRDIEKLLHLPQLEKLSIRANWPEYAGSGSRIPLMPQLRGLELIEASSSAGRIVVPEELALRFIRQSPSLQSLKLPLEEASDELLSEIAKLEKLRSIELNVQGKIGDLRVLRQCQQLYQLELSFKELPPERIADFNELKQIELLHLHHGGTTEIDLASLQARPKLVVKYNYDFHTQNFPLMKPDSQVKSFPIRWGNCNPGVVRGVAPPAPAPTASP